MTDWDKDKWIFFPFPKNDNIPAPIFVSKEDGVGEKGWTLEF